uniref:lactate racemase domain-containing protein n=1 Tax=Ndongobacter massiliensis TaxID=1871025 RepID=UPI000931AE2B|nr:lactate racemase domain-containing protein [Ndongobacter massiliensis]
MKISLPQNAYQGDAPLYLTMPDDWDTTYYPMIGDAMSGLTQPEIIDKLEHPVGSLPLSELARGKKKVCIVFDDITRGTPTIPMAHAVLTVLLDSGVVKKDIEFLCALGTHGAHDLVDHTKKLGVDIVHDYPVFNHNCYENNVYIGKSSNGVKVYINREFTKCDLRIGLGSITPHTMNGFSGGGKLLFPGIASINTIAQNHRIATEFMNSHQLNSSKMTGHLEMSEMRKEIEEMTQMAGQFFKIDCLYNSKLELIDIYAGDPIQEYYAALPAAKRVYAIPPIKDMDIVIANANAKASEATIAAGFGALAVRSGGDVVITDLTRRGQTTHYLFGSFGRETGGRLMGDMPSVRPNVSKYICYMPYPDIGAAHWFGEINKQIYVDTWEQALTLLRKRHGPGSKVAIISDATLAYYRE